MGPVPPHTAHWFPVGLADYVAASLKQDMTLHRKGRQGGQSGGELFSSPPSTIQAGLGVTGYSAACRQTETYPPVARRLRTSVKECGVEK